MPILCRVHYQRYGSRTESSAHLCPLSNHSSILHGCNPTFIYVDTHETCLHKTSNCFFSIILWRTVAGEASQRFFFPPTRWWPGRRTLKVLVTDDVYRTGLRVIRLWGLVRDHVDEIRATFAIIQVWVVHCKGRVVERRFWGEVFAVIAVDVLRLLFDVSGLPPPRS